MKNGKKIVGIALVSVILAVGLMIFIGNLIYYNGINKKIFVELGNDLPKATDFIKDAGEAFYITDISEIDKRKTGEYTVKINCNGKEKKVYIIIKDTLTPVIEAEDIDISVYEEPSAKELLTKIFDESKVKIEYKKAPDFGTVGNYDTIIRATDEAGNVTEVSLTVNICRVKDYVEYEFGTEFPPVESFIFSDIDTGKMITNLETTVDKPGTYYVTIEIDGKNYKTKLIAVDKTAPVVVGRDAEITYADIENKKALMPNDFVYSFEDAADVSMYFLDTPDYAGKSVTDVNIAISDVSGNTTIISRKLYVVEHKGMDVALYSGVVTDNVLTAGIDGVKVSLVSGSVDTNKLGRYPVVVNVDGEERNICINVVDPDAPSANAVAVVLDSKKDIVPEMFVADVSDTSKVKLEFENDIDTINRGIQMVRVKLTDEGGNYSYINTTLNILYDAIKPEITGVASVTTYIRQKPDYLLGVSAVDDVDGILNITVDDSKVNYEIPGIYQVTYKASDNSGNVITQNANVEVMNVTRELVDSMVDDILKDLVNESMTMKEKAWACYVYIQDNVRYINQADQSSTAKAAYDGLTLGVGDCFTYASLVEVFFERIGAETVFVKRHNGVYNHYWELCNLGTGWYHVDATPRNSVFKCFMKTDAELQAESSTYWIYDKTLYPEVATSIYE